MHPDLCMPARICLLGPCTASLGGSFIVQAFDVVMPIVGGDTCRRSLPAAARAEGKQRHHRPCRYRNQDARRTNRSVLFVSPSLPPLFPQPPPLLNRQIIRSSVRLLATRRADLPAEGPNRPLSALNTYSKGLFPHAGVVEVGGTFPQASAPATANPPAIRCPLSPPRGKVRPRMVTFESEHHML